MNRLVVGLTLGGLLLALGLLVGFTTPWSVLPGAQPAVDVARDFTSDQQAREIAFHREVRPWSYASLFWGLAVAGLLALTPLGGRLVAGVGRPLGGGWVWQVLLGTAALLVIGRVVTLPLDLWREQALRRYGLSTQSWAEYAVDVGKSVAVSAALSALALLALVALARALPRTWWAWGALGAAGLVVAGSFVFPVVVEPVFNKFSALPAGQLRTDLLELARRDGVAVDEVLVADASRRTTALNAYVSGFGATRRIVVYDTLLREAPPAEVRLIVAHELGHTKNRDVLIGTATGALGAAASVCALALLLSWPAARRWGRFPAAGDPRIVPLVLFGATVLTLLSGPAANLVSRRVEARADIHSLSLTRDVATFTASHRRLAVTNLSDLDPHPLAYAFFATHPTSPQRLALAREWQRLRG
ncbi:MAG TPA: M48 family metalloprotease [Mycobacteriales bacterium]|nr:M48 family metalloprotease [Mycobacteriales bacterium]